MIKPGGFLKKIGKSFAAPAKAASGAMRGAMHGPGKAMGGIFGRKKGAAVGGGKGMGSIFGGKKGDKMNALIAKHKESKMKKAAPTAPVS